MSFIKDLSKGFIRSAVNQVGRDTGRVISTGMYQEQSLSPDDEILNTYEKSKEQIILKWLFAVICVLILPFIGALIVIWSGYNNFTKEHVVTYYKTEQQAVFIRDRRYSTGKRPGGYRNVKVPVAQFPDLDTTKRKKIKAIGYFTIAIVSIVFYLLIFNVL